MNEFRPVSQKLSGEPGKVRAKIRLRKSKFITGANKNFSRLDLLDERIEAVQQETILVKVNRDAAANLPEHVIQQSGVTMPRDQRMQFGAMPPADGFRREIFAPLRTGIRHNDPRVWMKTADGMQGGVEELRRVKMGDAEGQQNRVCRSVSPAG